MATVTIKFSRAVSEYSADHGRVPVDWVSRLGLFSFGRLNFAASTGKRLSKEAHNERRLIAEQK